MVCGKIEVAPDGALGLLLDGARGGEELGRALPFEFSRCATVVVAN
jgi:hypothetical protein